jgi:hypothetical protein
MTYRDALALSPDAPEWGLVDTLAENDGTEEFQAQLAHSL